MQHFAPGVIFIGLEKDKGQFSKKVQGENHRLLSRPTNQLRENVTFSLQSSNISVP